MNNSLFAHVSLLRLLHARYHDNIIIMVQYFFFLFVDVVWSSEM